MQKGLELFGVEIEKEVVKEVKKKKRKGTITISYGYYSTDIPEKNIKKGDRFVGVDFEGYNEGSASPMKEEEVEEYVRQLYLKKSKDYKIEIIDKRKEQLKEREKFKDLKAKITIENYYTSDYNLPLMERKPIPAWSIWFDRKDSILGGCGSGAYNAEIEREGLEVVREEVLEREIQKMLNAGYKRENIEIIRIPLDEKQLKKWEEKHQKEITETKKRAEEEIKELSKKLKKLLKIKYGCNVKIKVLKDE